MLVDQSRWASPPTVTPEARTRIAEKLMTDAVPQIAALATFAADDKVQVANATRWLAKAKVSEQDRWKCEGMAQQTVSKPAIDLLATCRIPEVIEALCKNPGLTNRAQQRLLDGRQLTDDALYQLGENPNLSETALTKIISRGASRMKQLVIYNAVQHREDLSSKHLEMLRQFSDPLCSEDWGLTAILLSGIDTKSCPARNPVLV